MEWPARIAISLVATRFKPWGTWFSAGTLPRNLNIAVQLYQAFSKVRGGEGKNASEIMMSRG